MIQQLIPTLCLKKDNVLIPYWNLIFVKDEDEGEYYGDGYKIIDNGRSIYRNHLIECYWDTLNQKVVSGKIKYIEPTDLYEKGEVVYYEIKNTFRESIIMDVIFEEYDSEVVIVKNIEDYRLPYLFTEDEIKTLSLNDVYEFRTYKPYYLLDNGAIAKWSFELKKKYIEPTKDDTK